MSVLLFFHQLADIMTSKTLVAGIAGGLTLFATGMLVYVLFLPDFFAIEGASSQPGYLYIVLGEIAYGLLIALLFSRMGVNSMAAGAQQGALLGGMIALGMGLIYYGAYTFAGADYYLAEVVVWAVRWAVAGAVVGRLLAVKQAEPVAA